MRFWEKGKLLLASMGVYLAYLVGACVVTMLMEWLFNFLLDHFVLLSYPVLTVIRIVIYTLGVTAIIGVFGYFEGYREAKCPIGETLGAYVPAAIFHLLLSMLFKFEGFISGAVRFTAGMIHNGGGITFESLEEETPYVLFLLVFLGYTVLYGTVLVICKYFGAQKRVCDRAELRKNEDKVG
ncbi:MAG: hypothetical protein E7661_02990 [Ruminococcaceae bacterium]|nr:hypothetical protein [Oscillospiraceae bacterium]